jgi:hypothetical protein
MARAASLIVLAALVVLATAELPKGWNDLFQPPYQDCPSIMLNIGCLSKDLCYIPGGSNGVGFDVFMFDGQPNGNFTGMLMPKMDLMMMAIGVGGTEANPKGATGGFGIGDTVQYFVNSTTLLPSVQPFFVVTQDIRATKDGSKVLVVDGASSTNQVLWSTDAGKSFVVKNITTIMPGSGGFPRYGAIANDSTWYVTIGTWPNGGSSSSGGAKEHQLSERVKMVQTETGEWVRKSGFVSKADVPGPTGYVCVIAKTTDAGKTWHNVMYEAKNYYPNGIDCISPTHCIAVGEGFNEKAGAHVWLTVDGVDFMQVLHLKDNATGQWSLMSAAFVNAKEAWVGGSFATPSGSEGVLFSTKDGGYTWTQHRGLQFLGDITALSFAPDGYGFATAITIFDTSTVLRYNPVGPPRTPAPTWLGNFTQVQCTDNNCAVNCTKFSFPQNTCLGLNGGGSAIAKCADGILEQFVYPLSDTCSGLNEMQPLPLNECIQASNGGSFETFCGPSAYAPNLVPGELLMRH